MTDIISGYWHERVSGIGMKCSVETFTSEKKILLSVEMLGAWLTKHEVELEINNSGMTFLVILLKKYIKNVACTTAHTFL